MTGKPGPNELGAVSPVEGEFRTRQWVVLAGEHRTHTVHKEHGCRYNVDLAGAYFSARLGTERKRVADMVKPGQCVVDLFAGVGPFSILIGKNVPGASVVAVDKNPGAVKLLRENIRFNRLDNVTAVEDDARHAAVQLAGVDLITEEPTIEYESAWCEGEDFAGRNWAMYFTYTIA